MKIKKLFLCFSIVFIVFTLLNISGPVAASHSETEPVFSVRIIGFQSPVSLGDFMDFTYATQSISGIDGISKVNFWIEKGDEVITSGSDTILLESTEEQIRTAEVFIPSDFESGVYELKIEVNYQGHMQKAFRTIEINVENGLATINLGFGRTNIIIIAVLILLAGFNIYLIYRVKRRKIKEMLKKEGRYIKKNKVPILTVSFFVVLGILTYFLNRMGFLPDIPSSIYYLILILLLSVTLVLEKREKKKSK